MNEKKSELVEVKDQEVAVQSANTPENIISQAIAKGADLEQVEKLLELKFKYEADEARKAYNRAMAEFKANPPKINKDKEVSFETSKGKQSYHHATLGNVTEKISAELSKHGLSASWTTKQNGQIVVTCKITHIQGHSEETSLSAPSDTSGSKNAIQAIGSTITYLERYTLLALTGLATYDQDDDGSASQAVEYITDEQLGNLRDLLISKGLELKEKDLCEKYLKVDCLEHLLKSDYQKAMTAIQAKKGGEK